MAGFSFEKEEARVAGLGLSLLRVNQVTQSFSKGTYFEVAADQRRRLGVREYFFWKKRLEIFAAQYRTISAPAVSFSLLARLSLVVRFGEFPAASFNNGFGAIQPEPYLFRPTFAVFI